MIETVPEEKRITKMTTEQIKKLNLLTPTELARACNVSVSWVYKLEYLSVIHSLVRGKHLYTPDAVEIVNAYTTQEHQRDKQGRFVAA